MSHNWCPYSSSVFQGPAKQKFVTDEFYSILQGSYIQCPLMSREHNVSILAVYMLSVLT